MKFPQRSWAPGRSSYRPTHAAPGRYVEQHPADMTAKVAAADHRRLGGMWSANHGSDPHAVAPAAPRTTALRMVARRPRSRGSARIHGPRLDGTAGVKDLADTSARSPSRCQLAPTPPEHAAPGSGVWGPFAYFATNAGNRGSDALVMVSCKPHALATTGELSPGNGLSRP